jgi:hypothetical protein
MHTIAIPWYAYKTKKTTTKTLRQLKPLYAYHGIHTNGMHTMVWIPMVCIPLVSIPWYGMHTIGIHTNGIQLYA